MGNIAGRIEWYHSRMGVFGVDAYRRTASRRSIIGRVLRSVNAGQQMGLDRIYGQPTAQTVSSLPAALL